MCVDQQAEYEKENQALKVQNRALADDLVRTKEENVRRQIEICELKEEIETLEGDNAKLRELLTQYERKLYYSYQYTVLYTVRIYIAWFNVATDIPLYLFEKHESKWNEEMKTFALSLAMYSTKAYEFVRSKFPLPALRTIRSWLSKVDGSPGNLFNALHNELF